MWVYDPATLEMLDVNDAALRLFSRDRREFLTDGWDALCPPQDAQAGLDRARASERAASGDWRFVAGDGRVVEQALTCHSTTHDGRVARLAIASDFTAHEREQTKERGAVSSVLSDLLVGAVNVDLARGWQAGLDQSHRYEVMVTRLHGPGFHLTEPLLLDVARQVGALPGGLCGAFGAFGVLIVPESGDDKPKDDVASRLLAELRHRLPTHDLRVAVGGARPAARGIQWSFEEAVRLLSLADRLGIDGLVTPRRAVLPLILDGSPRTALSLLKVLQPLLDADQRSRASLVETLRCYLDNDASVHKTAERLHVHRNTIRSRLRTIEKALGGAVADDKVVLQMALLAHELAGSSGSDDAKDLSLAGPVE